MSKKSTKEYYGEIIGAIDHLVQSGDQNITDAAVNHFSKLFELLEDRAFSISQIVGECQEDDPESYNSDDDWKLERPFYNLGIRLGQMSDEWPDEFEVVEE